MRKRFLKILTLLFALCMTLGVFTACNGEENHVHDYKILKLDAEGHWYECECKSKVGVTKHTFVDGVCVCGYNATEQHTHVYTIVKSDANNHWIECACQAKTKIEAHVLVDNVCVCGYQKTDAHVHNFENINYDNESHWFECDCQAKSSIVEHDLISNECACGYRVNNAHQHQYSNIKFDNNNHWFECDCREKTSVVAHNLVNDVCICGYVNSAVHFHDFVNLKYDDDNHWFECECEEVNSLVPHTYVDGICACGSREDGVHVHDYKFINHDKEKHWFECDCQDKISIANHKLVNYACACGYRDENVHFHDYVIKFDEENHWFECDCKDIIDVTEHEFVNDVCVCGYESQTHIHEYDTAEYNNTQHRYKCQCGDYTAWQAHTIVNNACDCGYKITVIDMKDDVVYVEVGKSVVIDYSIRNYKDETLVWSSSNSQVATVSSGKVNGIKEGNVTITLKIGNVSATCTVRVFNYQNEVADTYTTTLEVYNYYYEGQVVSNDLPITLADYGLVYDENVKAVFTKNSKQLEATVRTSSNKLKVFIDLDVLGASNYGTGYTLVLSSADKKVSIPLSLIVTKFISEKDDLHYLFYYGNMDFSNEYFVYDGYFVQTTDIDMECIPLLNRIPRENHLPDEIVIDTANSDIMGMYQTGTQGDIPLYTYFNVDAGFKGTYDGNGYSIVNVSMYDDQGGLPRSRERLGGIFGNIARSGVVKNLGITATDTWAWYSYGGANLLAYNINGTLENVYAKITPTLYVLTETNPNPSTSFGMAVCISGAKLTNVVFELDIPSELLREYNANDIVNSKGKANYTQKPVCMYDCQGADAKTAKNNKTLSRKQTNTFKNCYFFYTDGPTGVYETSGFTCYTYSQVAGKTFSIVNDSQYFELSAKGIPTFVGLA